MVENASNASFADIPGDSVPSHPLADLAGGTSANLRVVLAPLSGITDVPFRSLVRSFGTQLVFSEMVASGELVRGDRESGLRSAADGAGVHAVQLAGREAEAMRQAARVVAEDGADLIDINMGCPAKKVVGGASGSALMRDLDHAERLIEATLEGAGGVPVSLKMRLGWDRATMNAPELARRAERAGIVWVTVHGRTRDQFYEGEADWQAIRAVKDAVSLPVVANGDLVARDQHSAMLAKSGADAVMIGRGACGRPWFPALVAGTAPADLARRSFEALVSSHYDAMLAHYGIGPGLRHARKHLGWYLERASVSPQARADLLRENSHERVAAGLRTLLSGITIGDVDPELQPLRKAA